MTEAGGVEPDRGRHDRPRCPSSCWSCGIWHRVLQAGRRSTPLKSLGRLRRLRHRRIAPVRLGRHPAGRRPVARRCRPRPTAPSTATGRGRRTSSWSVLFVCAPARSGLRGARSNRADARSRRQDERPRERPPHRPGRHRGEAARDQRRDRRRRGKPQGHRNVVAVVGGGLAMVVVYILGRRSARKKRTVIRGRVAV